ncbi:cob(I)yrinic acid a,c-diamide adenosyltransferase [Moraxella sp. FZLJ2107]|uniref:cob(I)yrinic acid a,c-diamide adenosyltransferase n=1 Tax=unclassified Moraxella TaxID=2685852 RepID=UPI00209C64AB|nr:MULTISPECIES: cob(I)yrinic acid a,c-diamide adenosyltransferase [unclassified Moraxella]USZ15875.1 cob(I)yrinic acid a,c-diamide adenosyltransferase [Moraxella sp. FZFQ2102]UTO06183.1 cob(I)yrinic acid a,c-diamide adenosyltransferase [Moraxella sp. FZLJ2107]UTO23460.1 cob(I)yrinic acid a,c-diamide adenosyltransferase [Moraxella sp. FZLJ2109]
MGNRLSKITTRTGDDGTTGLGDGSRLSKADLRFDTMGVVDGLNAHMGLLQAYLADKLPKAVDEISVIQHKLFNIGGEIALPNHREIGYIAISDDDVAVLETWADAHNEHLPYLKEFILPAGSVATAQAHIARSVCRDAERLTVRLNDRDGNISHATMRYLNRLSDYLFILARIVARLDGGSEVLWRKG